MIKPETLREQVDRLISDEPFQQFVLSLENGEMIKITHPRHIIYRVDVPGEYGFMAVDAGRFYIGHFDGVNNIQLVNDTYSSNGNGHHP